MKTILLILLTTFATVTYAQEGTLVTDEVDEMDRVFEMLEAQAEALAQLNNALFGIMAVINAESPSTSNRAVTLPPAQPVLDVTDARQVVMPQEARYAKPLHVQEAPDILPVTTRRFQTPAGYTMKLVEQTPHYVVTEYQQPDVWEAVANRVPVRRVSRVGKSNANLITIITDEPIQ